MPILSIVIIVNMILLFFTLNYARDSYTQINQNVTSIQLYSEQKEIESLYGYINKILMLQSDIQRFQPETDFLTIYDEVGQAKWRVEKTVSTADVSSDRVGLIVFRHGDNTPIYHRKMDL